MVRADIHKLMDMLGLRDITDREAWVSSTCPFTSLHENGISTRNSFGVTVGDTSVYHCFSCGKVGVLTNLPSLMFLLTGEDYPDIRDFIFKHEHVTTVKDEFAEPIKKVLKPISNRVLSKRFKPLTMPWRGVAQKTAEKWGLMFDSEKGRIIIPIKDKFGRIVAVKGRSLNLDEKLKYLLYTEFGHTDPKSSGIWYGMHLELNPKKALVLTEGELDTILLKQSGLVSNVWGVMGTGITGEQIKTLSGISMPLVFFFDNDKAGIELKEKLFQKMKGLMPMYEVKNYFGCKDAGQICNSNLLKKVLGSIDKKV